MSDGWIPANTPSARLLLVRKGLGLSLADITARTGIKGSTWSRWELGHTPPHWHSLAPSIAARLGVHPDWLEMGVDLGSRSPGWLLAEQLVLVDAA